MNSEYLWVEKYRPHKIEDCILPNRLKTVFQEYVNDENIPNLLLTGSAGVGKTTVARAMCEEIGLNHLFINGSEERGIDTLRTKIKGYASTVSLTGGRKVIIVDEADYLTPEAQAGLRGAIEEFSVNCSFIFTCNYKSRLIDAIHSRCSVIDFTLQKDEKSEIAKQLYRRLCNVLSEETVTYDKKVLAKIIEKFFPDFRRTLNELQRYSNSGSIDVSVISQIDTLNNFDELIVSLKKKDFTSMRKWVAHNSDFDTTTIFRKIYDNASSFMQPQSIPAAVVILGKYQYHSAFVADQEINLCACLTEMMVDCEYL